MLYDVKLISFNTDEIIMIDLCMNLLKFDASQAYECVDNMPSVLAEGVDMNKVKEIRAAFESEGAILDVVPVSEEQTHRKKTESESLKKNRERANSVTNSLKSSDLEIMNLKYNPYGNSKNNDDILKSKDNKLGSNKLEDRRSGVTYGRRSTDINPMSTNYGRRSTDVNPMMYKDDNSLHSNYITKDEEKNDKSMSVYTSDLKNDKSMSVYTSDLKNDKSMSVYTSDLKNDKSKSVYTGDLNSEKSKSVYTSDLKKDNQYSPYTGSFNDKSVYTSNLDDKIPEPYTDSFDNKSVYTSNMEDIKIQSSFGAGFGNDTNTFNSNYNNPFVQEETDNISQNISNSNEQYIEQNNEQQMGQEDFKFEVEDLPKTENMPEIKKDVEPPNIPYANNMMNFTQQQDVGEIRKDDDTENLFSLSGIKRNTAKGKLPFEKEQITCPKCGSAFVSTKRGQGLFGTSKVKYICEACKNKF